MKILLKNIILLLIIVFASSCKTKKIKANSHKNISNHKTLDNKHWGYDGDLSPSHWSEISNEFIDCAEGHAQSPIDVSTHIESNDRSTIKFSYHSTAIDELNNGHTIQADILEKNELLVDDVPYNFKQFHFHAPSEHQLNGQYYPMEMHLVHATKDAKLVVIGVLIKEGKENKIFSSIWNNVPQHVNEHVLPSKKIDLLHLLPNNHTYVHYSGSLTTPPCSEGVEWFVMENTIEMSKEQINKFVSVYNHNNRPLQKLEGRALSEGK
ncbi:MAG: carbonic anhydrase family protein [Saprospiraceae bacterium]